MSNRIKIRMKLLSKMLAWFVKGNYSHSYINFKHFQQLENNKILNNCKKLIAPFGNA